MLGLLTKIPAVLEAAKSVGDVISGKSDAEDLENIYEVGTDLLETFVPAAAPIIAIADEFRGPLIRVMNQQEPGKGDKFAAKMEALDKAMEQVIDRAKDDVESVTSMDDEQFAKLINQSGF